MHVIQTIIVGLLLLLMLLLWHEGARMLHVESVNLRYKRLRLNIIWI